MQIFFLNGLWRFLKYGHLPVKLHSSAPPPGQVGITETVKCVLGPTSGIYNSLFVYKHTRDFAASDPEKTDRNIG